MVKNFRPLGLALGALATTSLGGCYYGDVNGYGTTYASNDCAVRYGSSYYYDIDPYAYDDGYGYDCYDRADYGSGFIQIGFGGGWYDNYYYPGHGMWLFDRYRNRYPLRDHYLNYWGGRRAWWQHHGRRGDGHWNGGRQRGSGRHDRPGGWDGRDRNDDGPRGTRPGGRPGAGQGIDNPPTTTNPARPGGWQRPGRDRDGVHGTRPDRGSNAGPGNPPVADSPAGPDRPDRGRGSMRPAPAPDGNSGVYRPRQPWQGRSPDATAGGAPQPSDRAPGDSRPGVRQPLPTAQVAPAPAMRAAPPPPVAVAPQSRRMAPASQGDQDGGVREE